MSTAEIVALITAIGALTAALVSAGMSLLVSLRQTASAQAQAELNRQSAQKLEAIKSQLSDESAERNAKRAYEYDARKRLYERCEPLIFQLTERAEPALSRVYNLAEAAANGNLPDWTENPKDYYPRATAYRLFVPTVLFNLIQRSITSVDLRLSPRLMQYYDVGKLLYASFTLGVEIAAVDPPLSYDPNSDDEVAAGYTTQHMVLGDLENAVDAMTVKDVAGNLRCMTFPEFDKALSRRSPPEALVELLDLFVEFHPRDFPVMWRILVLQSYLYRALIGAGRTRSGDDLPRISRANEKERALLDWRGRDESVEPETVQAPISATETFIGNALAESPCIEQLGRY